MAKEKPKTAPNNNSHSPRVQVALNSSRVWFWFFLQSPPQKKIYNVSEYWKLGALWRI